MLKVTHEIAQKYTKTAHFDISGDTHTPPPVTSGTFSANILGYWL